jgi:hypothetical protein
MVILNDIDCTLIQYSSICDRVSVYRMYVDNITKIYKKVGNPSYYKITLYNVSQSLCM